MKRRTFLLGTTAVGLGGVFMTMGPRWLPGGFIRERISEIGRVIPNAPGTPAPHTWPDNAVTMTWLGHATVLINMYGVRILTDPTLFRRIGVDIGLGTLGPLRLVNCALTAQDLPDIDLLLVSHAHFDHLDTPSLDAVPGNPAVVMAANTSDLLPRRTWASVRELRWDETTTVKTPRGDVHVRAIEVKHWGARIRRDTWRGWTGFVLEREGSRLLIGGDTAMTPLYDRFRRREGSQVAAEFQTVAMRDQAVEQIEVNSLGISQRPRFGDGFGRQYIDTRLFESVSYKFAGVRVVFEEKNIWF
jgi:L-ascorbate metabolism protein UlaG (beta-lactamase superfamily)